MKIKYLIIIIALFLFFFWFQLVTADLFIGWQTYDRPLAIGDWISGQWGSHRATRFATFATGYEALLQIWQILLSTALICVAGGCYLGRQHSKSQEITEAKKINAENQRLLEQANCENSEMYLHRAHIAKLISEHKKRAEDEKKRADKAEENLNKITAQLREMRDKQRKKNVKQVHQAPD